jgi:hypothetical protein
MPFSHAFPPPVRYRNKEGKVSEKDTPLGYEGGVRDTIIMNQEELVGVIQTYFAQRYGHEIPPQIKITLLDEEKDLLVEVEFQENDYPIPF